MSIIERGKIRNENEFRLVDEEVNELCQTNPQSPEINLLNKLLLTYHEKKNKAK